MQDEIVTKKLSESEEARDANVAAVGNSNKTVWLAAVGMMLAAVLCCCCITALGFIIYYANKPAVPTLFPSPTASPAALIFADDFSRDDGTWDTYDDEWSAAWYEDGWFHLLLRDTRYLSWSNPWYEFTDFVLVVDAQQVSGPDDNSYGVLFRYQDKTNFYEFDISGDGYYILGKYVDDEWVDIVNWTASDHINQGENFNHIEVTCRGEQIEIYLNGHHLVTVTDDTFASGDIGLIAGTNEEPDVHVAFDNVAVWEAPTE